MPVDIGLVTGIFTIGIILIGVIGNVLTLVVIICYHPLRDVTGMFLANLAVADLLQSIIGMPLIAVSAFRRQWVFGETLCTLSGLTNSLFCITSVLTLTAISVDRWLAIVFPMKYQAWLTVERARIVLVYIWLHALSMAVLPVLGWSRYVYLPYEFICTIQWEYDKAFTIFVTVTSLVTPLIVTVVCYSSILRVARRQARDKPPIKVGSFSLSEHAHSAIPDVRVSEATIPDLSEAILPDVSKTSIPDVSEATIPDVSKTTILDESEATIPDASKTTIPDVSEVTIADVNITTIPDVSEVTIPDVSKTTIPDVSEVTIADVNIATIPDVSEATIPDVSKTTIRDESEATIPDASKTTIPDVSEVTIAVSKATIPDVRKADVVDGKIEEESKKPGKVVCGNENGAFIADSQSNKLKGSLSREESKSTVVKLAEYNNPTKQGPSRIVKMFDQETERDANHCREVAGNSETVKERKEQNSVGPSGGKKMFHINPFVIVVAPRNTKASDKHSASPKNNSLGRVGKSRVSPAAVISSAANPWIEENPERKELMVILQKDETAESRKEFVSQIRSAVRRRGWMAERRTDDGRDKRKEMKVALILLVVNGTFILCWLPHFIGMMCLMFTDGSCPFPDSFFIITTTLAMLNSGCNPFIYTLTYRKFRKAFRRVLPCFRTDHTGYW